MRYYVSWKTTSYYRKDSLKLAARCPVSVCWPFCYNTHIKSDNKCNLMILCSCDLMKYENYDYITQSRMWANAQRDGRPAEYRWRPLFNAAKFG